jgi:hypothetical protein
MQVRRRLAASLVVLLFVVAETFALAPQLHGCLSAGAGVDYAATGRVVLAGHVLLARQDECPACHIASLAMVAQSGPPLAAPLLRTAPQALSPAPRACWRTLDRSCSRAPPRS